MGGRTVRTLLLGILLLAVAAGTVFGGRWYLQREIERASQIDPSEIRTSLYIASEPLPRGTQIAPDQLQAITVVGPVPGGAMTDAERILGRVVLNDMLAGQFFMNDGLSDNPADAGLASLIPFGHRAFSLRVDEGIAAGEFLRPGDRVDIMVVLTGRTTGGEGEALTLLQDVQVLSVGEALSADARDAAVREQSESNRRRDEVRTVSVAVTPADGDRLLLARQLGTYAISLRNPNDRTIIDRDSTTLASLRDRLANVIAADLPADRQPNASAGSCQPSDFDPGYRGGWAISNQPSVDIVAAIWSGFTPAFGATVTREIVTASPDEKLVAAEVAAPNSPPDDGEEHDASSDMLIPAVLPASLSIRNVGNFNSVDPTIEPGAQESPVDAVDSASAEEDDQASGDVGCPTVSTTRGAPQEVMFIMGDRIETQRMDTMR